MDFEYWKNQRFALLTAALCALFASLFAPVSHGAESARVDSAVQHLIAHVARSNLVFIRNAREYSAQDAAAHMQKKYAHFRDDIKTTEDFIELCASRSLLTGKPYLVIDENGATVPTAVWLTAELEMYRKQ